jgi:hypothetical protein
MEIIRKNILFVNPQQVYCFECGEKIRAIAEICPKCGIRQKLMPKNIHQSGSSSQNKSKVTAGILALLLGNFGAQHFYLENSKWGIIYLVPDRKP